MDLTTEQKTVRKSRIIDDANTEFDSHEQLIQLERVRLTLTEVDAAGAGITLSFLIGTIAVWGYVAPAWIALFWVALIVEVALKIKLSNDFKRDYDNYSVNLRKYLLGISFGTIYPSIVYSLTFLVIFIPMPEENRWLVAVCIASVFVIISTFSSEALGKGWLLLFALVIPISVALLLSGEIMLILIVVTLLTCVLVVHMRGVKLNKRLRNMIVYHKENDALLHKLSVERKKAEEQREVAEQAVINKNKFIAAASHDLRQPLHALGLFQDSLKRGVTDESLHPILSSMENSTNALRELFEDLLDVSRLDAGVIKPTLKNVSIESLCDTLGDEFQEIAKQQNSKLRIEHNDLAVFTDDHLIERIFRNLLTNAIKHTHDGEIRLYANALDDELAEIVIEDTGSGIPESQLKHVFKEYYQSDDEDHYPTSGFGLGLAIVRRIASLLHIKVSIESELGKGTKVSLQLPLGDTAEFNSQSKVIEYPPMVEPQRIAVLDDNEQILRGMKSSLEQWNHETHLYSSASRLIDDLAHQRIVVSVAMVDYHLGDQPNGLQVASQIIDASDEPITVVILTGESSPEHMSKLYGSNFDVLQKPISPEEIQRYLSSIVEQKNLKKVSAAAD